MSSSSEGNPRNKVALKPGRSLMDWIRLTNSSAPGELSTGRRGSGNTIRDVSLEELGRHNTKNDAWLALRGTVRSQFKKKDATFKIASFVTLFPILISCCRIRL